MKKKQVKLTIHDISKNPEIERIHFIDKIKRNERVYMFYLSSIFFIIMVVIAFSISMIMKSNISYNEYYKDGLVINYNNSISNIVTLTDKDNMSDKRATSDKMYKFNIKNNAKKNIKYQIIMKKDTSFIELDKCSDNLFDISDIKYNVNGGKVNLLDEDYVLYEGVINKGVSKNFAINIWIDDDTLLLDKHYHGIIDVNIIK